MKPTKTLGSIMTLAVSMLLAPFAIADDGSDVVQVPSLQVKERLKSIEQITVSTEKPAQATEVESAAVAELLQVADLLDQQSEATEPQQ